MVDQSLVLALCECFRRTLGRLKLVTGVTLHIVHICFRRTLGRLKPWLRAERLYSWSWFQTDPWAVEAPFGLCPYQDRQRFRRTLGRLKHPRHARLRRHVAWFQTDPWAVEAIQSGRSRTFPTLFQTDPWAVEACMTPPGTKRGGSFRRTLGRLKRGRYRSMLHGARSFQTDPWAVEAVGG